MIVENCFSPSELRQLEKHGLTFTSVQQQIGWFQQGFPFVHLLRPCTMGDGIVSLSSHEVDHLVVRHDHAARAGRIMKFVPASGAASRMFQSLLSLVQRTEPLTLAGVDSAAEAGDQDCRQFRELLANFPRLAFTDALRCIMTRNRLELDTVLTTGPYQDLLMCLLTTKGLNYANLPKGLIPFHRYMDHTRTPFEEHLVEAAAYIQDEAHLARVHFTVPLEHQEIITTHIHGVLPRYEQTGCRYLITYSTQKPATDTIAVDHNNKPFRSVNGQLVFRPGGHGALLENLNDLKGDLIFIKNIDNVVPDRLKSDTYRYKKVLCGYLIALQEELFNLLRQLKSNPDDSNFLAKAFSFAQEKLHIHTPKSIYTGAKDTQYAFLFQKLNRPIRVCGMVRNTGEPGGGPFWVQEQNGSSSLQIIESSQVNMTEKGQWEIWRSATHFNPVDLVCGVRDFQGEPFDLHEFVNPQTGFISIKSKDGKELRALELPGLWNGAMAEWNTIFVEVPLSTFNPVKTVYDLLRPEHLDL